ncbi:MAG: TonB-dependent receptor [Pseudomonadota bacterium]
MKTSSACRSLFAFRATLLLSSMSSAHWALAQASEEEVRLGQDAELLVLGERVIRTEQETSAGMTIIRGEAASQANQRDIDDVIDGLANVLANEGFKPPSIRGVDGLGGDRPAITAGAQPRVPLVVDDLATPSGEASGINQSSTWDLRAVEVARGPQPTSTGRNAIGGAIRVYTNDPSYDHAFSVRARGADQPDLGVDAVVNLPLIDDQLALRLVTEFSSGESYIDNNPNPLPAGFDPNDEEILRLRGKVLIEPEGAPGLRVLLSGNYSELSGPTEGFFNGDIDDLSVAPPFFVTSTFEEVEQWNYTLRTDYALSESATLVARVSQLENRLEFVDTGETFMGFSLGTSRFDKDFFEAEAFVRFEDVGPVSTAVLGIIYAQEDEIGLGTSALLAFDLTGEIENLGVYGEVEVALDSIAPGLFVLAGGRFENDQRTRTTNSPFGLVGTGDFEEGVFLPKLGLRFEANDQIALGYTYSEGFRGGGLDVDLSAPFTGNAFSAVEFTGERLKQHEIYIRGANLGEIIDIEAAAFFYTFKDAHVSGSAIYPESGEGALGNIPEAEGYGVELSVSVRPVEGFELFGSLGLLDTEITEVTTAQAAFLGSELPRAPGATGAVGLRVDTGFGLDFTGQVRFVGDHLSALSQPRLGSYEVVDITAGYAMVLGDETRLRLDAYIDNLFDKRYQTFTEISALGALGQAGQPFTIGAAVTVDF